MLVMTSTVSVETALRALAECGYAMAIAPKFSRLRIDEEDRAPLEPGRG